MKKIKDKKIIQVLLFFIFYFEELKKRSEDELESREFLKNLR